MGETVDDKIRLNYFLSLNEFSMLLISAEKAVVVAEGLLFLVVVWESHIIIIVLTACTNGKLRN